MAGRAEADNCGGDAYEYQDTEPAYGGRVIDSGGHFDS